MIKGVTRVLKLGGGRAYFMPNEGSGARLKGRGRKVTKDVVKAVYKILGNFEVTVQIRVVGLPPISKHRKERLL